MGGERLESSGDTCCSQGESSPRRAMRPHFNKNRAFYKEKMQSSRLGVFISDFKQKVLGLEQN